MVDFTPWPLYRTRQPQYPLHSGLGGTHSSSGHFGVKKNFLSVPSLKSQIIQHLAQSLHLPRCPKGRQKSQVCGAKLQRIERRAWLLKNSTVFARWDLGRPRTKPQSGWPVSKPKFRTGTLWIRNSATNRPQNSTSVWKASNNYLVKKYPTFYEAWIPEWILIHSQSQTTFLRSF